MVAHTPHSSYPILYPPIHDDEGGGGDDSCDGGDDGDGGDGDDDGGDGGGAPAWRLSREKVGNYAISFSEKGKVQVR